jgi:hypothetical protein
MALRNAFDNLGTESALRRIANLLTFARDSNDRIRVTVDGQPGVSVFARNNSTNMINDSSVSYYSASSWNATDSREPLRQQYRANMNLTQRNRWTY